VASADQKADLERQLGRLADYASRERLTVIRSVSEIGSGLNGHRAKVMRLLADPAVRTIVVACQRRPDPPQKCRGKFPQLAGYGQRAICSSGLALGGRPRRRGGIGVTAAGGLRRASGTRSTCWRSR
jgi:hypothetical protein